MRSLIQCLIPAALFALQFNGHSEEPTCPCPCHTTEKAQNRKDPFDVEANAPKNIRVMTEYIEVSQTQLTRLLLESPHKTSDATALRLKAQSLVDSGSAKIINSDLLTIRPFSKVSLYSGREHTYPTQYTNPPGPEDEKNEDNSKTPTTKLIIPSGFDIRNCGSHTELEPSINGDSTIRLTIATELLHQVENTTWQVTKDNDGNPINITMPNFKSMSCNTGFDCIPGQYTLAGILSPHDNDGRVLLFIRCDILSALP